MYVHNYTSYIAQGHELSGCVRVDAYNLVLIFEVARGPPVAKLESFRESVRSREREKRVKLNLISRVGYGAGVDASWAP